MLPLAAFSSADAAMTVPLLFTAVRPVALVALAVERTNTCSMPACEIITSSAAARPTWPLAAVISPWLSTVLPMKMTSPPSALILPRFVTPASPVPVKCRLPELKSASVRSRVLARKPPVLMMPPGPTRTPLPLRR